MGKGDKKTKRGKLFQGSFGATRRRKIKSKLSKTSQAVVSVVEPTESKPVPAEATKASKPASKKGDSHAQKGS